MITQETAARIWECYREIEAGRKLLADLAEAKQSFDGYAGTLPDAFGRRRQLELGIPSGANAHRIFGVAQELAESVIRAHIAAKQAELAAFNEQARIELSADA